MVYLLLAVAIVLNASQNFITKQYNLKTETPNTYVYTGIVAFFAMIFFVITSRGKFEFNIQVAGYSAVFALFYSMAIVGTVQAIRIGSLSITALLNQCSLIIPTLFGLVVLNDDVGHIGYIGIAALFTALVLVKPKYSDGLNSEKKISSRWLFWMAIGFAGNGMCSTVQKLQQLKYDGCYKNEFMMIALFIVFILMFVAAKPNKTDIKRDIVDTLKYSPVNGIANGACNMLIMVLTGLLPTAVLFPSVSAGGMILTFIISLTVYKEKLPARQLIGYVLGVISIVLINIY